ncbi:glycosyltransferase family 2 protein [Marinobacter sp. ATCH36]|uniref:glycosyltransferase family 2 protein n=1 Tax=Marinobacter sp. ATCH36 TaxID=2945106 RepID=UPI002020DAD8|nr:glycosyltransferase family 2 protein [Marinobacter sp. ATCH36]MCL7945133.1 glycosyltransferase family 2 protein [Marinobacter sp. ATCH36]
MHNTFAVFSKLFRKKATVAIGAIFKNEVDYVLEWLAWHRVQGIHHFIVYDNGSDDGTLELLSKLEKLKFLRLHTIETKAGAQQEAYQRVLRDYEESFDLIGFIDADEFLMPQGSYTAADYLRRRFKDPDVGALGINWRVYGTGNQKKRGDGFVLKRFSHAASDIRHRNYFLKSVYRPKAVNKVFPHRAALKPGYVYVNTQGEQLKFANFKQGIEPVRKGATTGVSLTVCNAGLRVNHYALKSEEEFIGKKKYKGDAVIGKDHVRGDAYFREFNLNDEVIPVAETWFRKMSVEHDRIARALSNAK